MISLETTLRRIIVGYRAIAMLWMLSLALVSLASDEAERPAVIVAAVGLVAAWTSLTLWISFRRPGIFRSWAFLGLDTFVSALILVSPDLAGSPNFVGGYPLSSVLIGVLGKGLLGATAPVLVLVSLVLIQIAIGDRIGDPTVLSSNVLVYPFMAAPVTWAVGALRRSDRLRIAAESNLEDERAERIRAEERSELAAHLHDSVLQTLALIQRSSTDADEVVALARGQERDLRSWLYGSRLDGESFESAMVTTGAEIEESYKVPIELVVVSDAPLSDGLRSMIAAAREAMINAAKHSGASEISVFAEVIGDRAMVFVRDRGTGFDPESIPEDRKGVSESIQGRMARHGGSSVIDSKPGTGTEVRLTMHL